MNIYDYIQRCEKIFKLRLKFATPVGDPEMEKIERVAMRYDPIRISNPHKTIFQSNPLDFPNIGGAEIFIVDAEFSLPVSTWVLAKDVQAALGIPEKFIVIRDANSPIEIDLERLAAEAEIAAEAEKKGLNPVALLAQDDMDQSVGSENGGDFYGAGRNSPLLAKLSKLEKDRAEDSVVEPKNPLFKWLGAAETKAEDFNKVAAVDATEKLPGKTTWRKVFKKGSDIVTITRKSEG